MHLGEELHVKKGEEQTQRLRLSKGCFELFRACNFNKFIRRRRKQRDFHSRS